MNHQKKFGSNLKSSMKGVAELKISCSLTLKREFKLLEMKNDEGVKSYSTKLMNIVNQIILYGDDFLDHLG